MLSAIHLAKDHEPKRLPTQPEIARPDEFLEKFDQTGLFYDVFRDRSAKRVWLIGPVPKNLEKHLRAAHATGNGSGLTRRLKFVKCQTACIAYVDLPETDNHLTLEFAGKKYEARIGENRCEDLAGHRVVFCLNNNNRLKWIQDWAKFYQKEHGATAVVVFDNGSNAYSKKELELAISAVQGIEKVLVVGWPYKFGANDRVGQQNGLSVFVRFAQPVMYFEMYLRYGQTASSLLNVDIDELLVSDNRESIFELAEKRFFGCVKFERYLVENVAKNKLQDEFSFVDFCVRQKAKLGRQDSFKKWAFAPSKVKSVKRIALPNTHWIRGIINPYQTAKQMKCFHFAGIGTGWQAQVYDNKWRVWQLKRHITGEFDPELHIEDQRLKRILGETLL